VVQSVDQAGHLLSALAAVGVPVGGDHLLVDAPGRLHLDIGVGGAQVLEALSLLAGEQVGAGKQCSSGPVERVAGESPVAVEILLDPAPASVQRVAG
jgi:hypothetical protein